MELKDKIVTEIKKIYDPEIPVNIYELGLIYDISTDKSHVKINSFSQKSSQKHLLSPLETCCPPVKSRCPREIHSLTPWGGVWGAMPPQDIA